MKNMIIGKRFVWILLFLFCGYWACGQVTLTTEQYRKLIEKDKELTQKIEEYKKQDEAKTKNIKIYLENIDRLGKDLQKIKSEKEGCEKSQKQLENELASLRAKIEEYEKSLNKGVEMEEELKKTAKNLKDCNINLNQAQEENEKLKERVSLLSISLEKEKQLLATKVQEVERIQQSLSAFEKMKSQQKERVRIDIDKLYEEGNLDLSSPLFGQTDAILSQLCEAFPEDAELKMHRDKLGTYRKIGESLVEAKKLLEKEYEKEKVKSCAKSLAQYINTPISENAKKEVSKYIDLLNSYCMMYIVSGIELEKISGIKNSLLRSQEKEKIINSMSKLKDYPYLMKTFNNYSEGANPFENSGTINCND